MNKRTGESSIGFDVLLNGKGIAVKHDDGKMDYLLLTDEDLFNAMNLNSPGMEKIKSAVGRKDWDLALREWGEYWASRRSPKYFVDARKYVDGINGRLPHIGEIVIADADMAFRPDYKHGTYKPRRKGTGFQWVDNCDDYKYIGLLGLWFLKCYGRAYVLTGDEKYVNMFQDVVCSFWDAIPEFPKANCVVYKGLDIFWNDVCSPLRCLILIDCYWLMRRSKSLTPELHSRVLRLILSHARYVLDNHMRSYWQSNAQASLSAWMVTAGVMFPEFRESARWFNAGMKRTRQRIVKNFDRDGAQIEQCPQYHLAGLRDMTRILLLLQTNGMRDISGDRHLWGKLKLVYDFPVRITHPSGHLAVLNSAVYGTEAQAFFPVGIRLFGSRLQKWAAKRYIKRDFVPVAKNVSEYVNFMDGDWVKTLKNARVSNVKPPRSPCDLMEDSGIAMLRSGWDENALSMMFDFNRKPWGGHRHLGRLSFDLFGFGVPMVVNPGSTASYSLPVYDKWCFRTIGHNTVLIDDFRHTSISAKLMLWHEGKRTVFVSARMKTNDFQFRRSILFVRGEYFFIFDRLAGKKHRAPLAWLLHSPLPISGRRNGLIAGRSGKPGFLIVPDSATMSRCRTVIGKGFSSVPVTYHKNYKPDNAWREDTPYLRLNSESDSALGGQTYGVLLAPFSKIPPRVRVTAQSEPNQTSVRVHSVSIEFPDHVDSIMVDYRKGRSAFTIARKNSAGTTLWRGSNQP